MTTIIIEVGKFGFGYKNIKGTNVFDIGFISIAFTSKSFWTKLTSVLEKNENLETENKNLQTKLKYRDLYRND